MKTTIIYQDDNTAIVTKAFEKKAKIFGTEEYKLWRAYKQEWPEAKMTTKKIARNPEKKTNRNRTYAKIELFIRSIPECDKWLEEFELVKQRSVIQKHPYGYVWKWFEARFPDYADSAVFSQEKVA